MPAQPSEPLVERTDDGPVATVTIVGGKGVNVVGTPVVEAVTAAVVAAGADPAVRVLVLRGAGERAFVGGADIAEMAGLERASAEAFITRLRVLCDAVRHSRQPVVARLAGWCLGAGLEVALSCDLRVAGAGARFGMPEVAVGIPSVIHAALLPSMVGASRAAWLLLTGETVDAPTALAWGLVHEVVPDDELDVAVRRLADRLAGYAPEALAQQKRLLRRWSSRELDAAVDDSVEQFGLAYLTGEPAHYMQRFLQRPRDGRRPEGGDEHGQ